jgi:hypothetical protein
MFRINRFVNKAPSTVFEQIARANSSSAKALNYAVERGNYRNQVCGFTVSQYIFSTVLYCKHHYIAHGLKESLVCGFFAQERHSRPAAEGGSASDGGKQGY